MRNEIRVADEVWLATASLHRKHPERENFAIGEIMTQAEVANATGVTPLRPGVKVHVYLHCVANRPRTPGGTACCSRRPPAAAGSTVPAILATRSALARKTSPTAKTFQSVFATWSIGTSPTTQPLQRRRRRSHPRPTEARQGDLGKRGRRRLRPSPAEWLAMSRIFWDTNLFVYLFEDIGDLTERVVSLRARDRTRR